MRVVHIVCRYLPHHVARPWLATTDAGGTDVDPTRGRKRKMHGGALAALQQQQQQQT